MTATGDDIHSATENLIREYVRAEEAFAPFVAAPDRMVDFPEGRRQETAFTSCAMFVGKRNRAQLREDLALLFKRSPGV